MKLLERILLVLILALVLPVASCAQQYPSNFTYAFKQALERRQEADKKLIDNMEHIADWLVQFRQKNGHFPEAGVERDKAVELFARLMKPNPYTVTGVASAQESKNICPVRFVEQLWLIDTHRQEWEKKVPTDWKADPGSITIIINQYDYLVIWGSGAERQPVFDNSRNKPNLIWRELNSQAQVTGRS